MLEIWNWFIRKVGRFIPPSSRFFLSSSPVDPAPETPVEMQMQWVLSVGISIHEEDIALQAKAELQNPSKVAEDMVCDQESNLNGEVMKEFLLDKTVTMYYDKSLDDCYC